MTDTERLDWIEKNGEGWAIISDDAGRWTVSGNGFQSCADPDVAMDVETSFFIEADKWCNSIREAIDKAIAEQEESNGG